MYQICPVCNLKRLAGNHKKACMRLHPMKWVGYYNKLRKISLSRMGRVELIDRLERVRVE